MRVFDQAEFGAWKRQDAGHGAGKIRGLGTRILREGEDAGFVGLMGFGVIWGG
jgi:hypothetical protein